MIPLEFKNWEKKTQEYLEEKVLSPILTELFTGMLQGNEIPRSWKEAKMVIITKEEK